MSGDPIHWPVVMCDIRWSHSLTSNYVCHVINLARRGYWNAGVCYFTKSPRAFLQSMFVCSVCVRARIYIFWHKRATRTHDLMNTSLTLYQLRYQEIKKNIAMCAHFLKWGDFQGDTPSMQIFRHYRRVIQSFSIFEKKLISEEWDSNPRPRYDIHQSNAWLPMVTAIRRSDESSLGFSRSR